MKHILAFGFLFGDHFRPRAKQRVEHYPLFVSWRDATDRKYSSNHYSILVLLPGAASMLLDASSPSVFFDHPFAHSLIRG